MGLLSGIGKGIAHAINDSNAKRQHKKAGTKAYKEVADDIRKAKRTGNYFDAKKAYNAKLQALHNKIDSKHDFNANVINGW